MRTRPPNRPSVARRRTFRVALAASASLTIAVMPVFLLGALSDDIGADLGFGSARTGIAVTMFFVSGALTAVGMGRVTDRIGATSAMRIGVTITGIVLLGIGVAAGEWWQLTVLLAFGGLAVGLVDTGGARAFADAIRAERQGLAFGVKEASVPTAALVAGLSIPLVAQRLGWGPTFALVAAAVPGAWWLIPSGMRGARDPAASDPGAGDVRSPLRLVAFTLGVGAAAAASSAAATLFVPAATDGNWSASAAGFVLAAGSVVSISVRVAVGWVGDRSPGHTGSLLAGGVALGAVGAVALAVGTRPLFVPAALLLLGAGWGWSGLAFLTAVRANPEAPATAAGVVLTGLAGGGSIGPAAFGLLASTWSYRVSWAACSVALLVGALLVFGARLHAAEP